MIDPEDWLRVWVGVAPGDADAVAVAEALIAAGGTAVEETPERLGTYLPLSGTPEQRIAEVRAALASAGLRTPPEIGWSIEAARDWAVAWKAGLGARRVGARIVLHPSWIEPAALPEDIALAIDPGMAFGTGEHATTRGALRLLEAALRPGMTVLDAGTGSGVLAIAARRLGASHVVGVDVDGEAVATAAANVRANDCQGGVRLEVAAVTSAWLGSCPQSPFDLILANILSGVLVPLLTPLSDALAPDGALIVSGILEDEAGVFRAAAEAKGLSTVREDIEDGWWSALLA
ncbi:MAG: 50S ribosomal protein L11 methyltransferase [Gemmatimonadota bacterium]